MILCDACNGVGRCRKPACCLVSDSILSNPEFIRDVRNFAASLNVPPGDWIDFLLNEFSRFEGCIVDGRGAPVILRTEIFEPSDEVIDEDRAERFREQMTAWFRDTFCTPCPDHVKPRVRPEARERFIICATILRALYPGAAMIWGVRPANDNAPP
jgi:hypothetical protein